MADGGPNRRAPERFDPWSGSGYGGFRWLAFSSGAHVAALFVLATVTLTVMAKVEEVRVEVVNDFVGDGAPSLQDLAGVLHMEKAVPQRAVPRGPRIRNVRAPRMPRIAGIAPKLGRGPQREDVAPQLSFAVGGVGGLGGDFGDYVGGLRKVGLDVALVVDTTDSMQFVIEEVKEKLSLLVRTIQRMVPTSRVGIVVYRDQGDDYVVKWTDLSFHTAKLTSFLSNISAAGGGDWEEAVLDALDSAVHDLKWRKKSRRVIILVGGSPPHDWEVPQILDTVRDFRRNGGHVSAIDVTKRQHYIFDLQMWRALEGSKPYEPSPLPEYYREVGRVFDDIASAGGGELISLQQDKALVRELLQVTFGSRWKVEMATYLDELS
jgi:hypothetical protein